MKKNSKNIASLMDLGLKENEATVYLAALSRGDSGIGDLEKATGLHKQLIYLATSSLQEKGLLSIFEIRGRKQFRTVDPSALEEYAALRLDAAKELSAQLQEIVGSASSHDIVQVYRGASSIRQYYLQSVRAQPKQSTVCILGQNSERFFELFDADQDAFERLERTRINREITWQLLLFGSTSLESGLNEARPLIDLRVRTDVIQLPLDTVIWHDHVALLFYAPIAYILDIDGAQTVQGFKEYFDLLWS